MILFYLKNTYFIASFLLLFRIGFSQELNLNLNNFSIEDGLAGNSVNAVFQDHSGFLWIGTTSGLSRFDGYNFENYYKQVGDTNSLSNNFINDIFEDSDNNLWIATRRGLNLYVPKQNNFLCFHHTENSKSLSNNLVSLLFEDSEKNLWIGTYDGIDLYDNKNKTFINFRPYKGSNIKNWTIRIIEDKNKNLWIGTYRGGIYHFNKNNGTFTYFVPDKTNKFSLSGSEIRDMILDRYGNIWIATLEGLNIFNVAKLEFYNSSNSPGLFSGITDNRILSLAEDQNGIILIGTLSGGLNIYNRKSNSYYHLSESNTSTMRSVSRLYIDKKQTIWIGTYEEGLNLCSKRPSFYSWHKIPNDDNSLVNNHVRCISSDNNNLWLGTENGLSYFDRKTKQFKNFPAHIPELQNLNLKVSCIEIVNENLLRLGTNNGLFTFDIINKTYNKLKGIPSVYVFGIYTDVKENVWVTTLGKSLYCIRKKENDIIQIDSKNEGNKNPWSSDIACLYKENDSILWLGYEDGFDKFNINTLTFDHFPFRFDNTKGISGESVWQIIKDSRGILWISTQNGLTSYNEKEKIWKYYFINDGLPCNTIQGTLEDQNGNIWISSELGLSKLTPSTGHIVNFTRKNGIQDNFFHSGSCLKTNDGYMVFGGRNGFTLFHPDSILLKSDIDRIIITGFILISKETGKKKQIYDLSSITLPYYLSSIKIDFSVLDLSQNKKIQYGCKLENIDKDWNLIGDQHSISYLTLAPGNYNFKVKAIDLNFPEKAVYTELKFTILPPFWKTIWFRILMWFIFAAAILTLYFIRINRMKRRELELEILVQTRTEEIYQQKEEILTQAERLSVLNSTKDKLFSIIGHDLKNPFHAIIGFSDLLYNQFENYTDREKKEFIDTIRQSAGGAAALLENLLQWSRTQTSNISFVPQMFDIYEIINENIKLLDVNAKKKNILLLNAVPEKSNVFCDRNMISTVVRNLINNAIKFTPEKGKIEVFSVIKDNNLDITVKDTGTGMSEETMKKLFSVGNSFTTKGTSGEAGTGLGLIICKEFVETNSGKISVQSRQGEGSAFTISLPNTGFSVTPKNEAEITQVIKTVEIDPFIDKNKYTILVIDDDGAIRKQLSILLSANFKVIQAENGIEGMTKAQHYSPDLIVCDVAMPSMDGIEVCKKLKSDHRTDHIPIIILTALLAEEIKISGAESGADDYITKPFNSDFLLKRIHNLISLRAQLKKKFRTQTNFVPGEIALNNFEEQFLSKAFAVIEKNIDNPDFSVNHLAREIGISRSLLYVKIKTITGQAVNDFILSIRLKKAAGILKENNISVQEVAVRVGFKSLSHFSRSFTAHFGISPLKYKRNN